MDEGAKSNNVAGHRKRLRDKFLKIPLRSLPDYEILEMLLFNASPRKDTKQLAKELLNRFGSLARILNAEPHELKEIDNVGDAIVFQFKLALDLLSRVLLPSDNKDTHIFNNWHTVINYCQLTSGFKNTENYRVLYLNKKNILIAEEVSEAGTVDKIQIYPREIAKKALFHNASSIILVHNHPSGDPQPSNEDIKLTELIVKALEPLNIQMHDHIIVANHNSFSFKGNQLII